MSTCRVRVLPLLVAINAVLAFQPPSGFRPRSSFLGAVRPGQQPTETLNTLDCSAKTSYANEVPDLAPALVPAGIFLSTLVQLPEQASAAAVTAFSTGQFDPSTFKPICSVSDGFYRVLQQGAQTLVGPEAFNEYGPLIASGLLRVRLELCVVESFFNEAVGPFIQENGISWILPLHETIETFLAGVVFSLASTFILVGSTKILSVVFTYADFLIGLPCRVFGGFIFDRTRGKPLTFDLGVGPFQTRVLGPRGYDDSVAGKTEFGVDWNNKGFLEFIIIFITGTIKAVGLFLGFFRDIIEGVDVFVGRYLVLWATLYIGIKFLHFKVFPDFPLL